MTIAGRLLAPAVLLGAAGCSSDDAHYPPMPPPFDPPAFVVFFAWDDASISRQGENTIRQFAHYIANNTQFLVNIVGHTDRSEALPTTWRSPSRRANAVRARRHLVRSVPAESIVLQGKEKPAADPHARRRA